MILHRPGCDVLDKIVRDLAFVLHHHEIEVQSPLLEMSHIDAEGGIASYIQRNIYQSNIFIILVTESVKGLCTLVCLLLPLHGGPKKSETLLK